MRVVRNNGYIRRRQRLSRLTVAGGIIALGGSIAMTFRPALVLPAYLVLAIGFLLFNWGMQETTKWNRQPRPDELLDQALRRLNDRYTLIHYPEMPRPRAEHVLVSPAGLVVLATREIGGRFRVENDRWKRLGNRLVAFFLMTGSQLGNPTRDALAQQESLRRFLAAQGLPGEDLIDALIVFVNPKAELEVISSELTVVMADELVGAVRDLGTEALLHTKQREDLVAALSQGDNVEGPISLPPREPAAKRASAT